MKMSNELKIGLTALVAILVAFLGYRVMRDLPFFDTSNVYYTQFDNTSGLQVGSEVNYIGVKVGTVKTKELTETDSVLVSLNIDRGFMIPKGSVAFLRTPAVLGASYIEIIKSDNSEFYSPGDMIKGINDKGLMSVLVEKGDQISSEIISSIEGIEKLVSNLNNTLNEDNKANIASSLASLSKMTGDLQMLITDKKSDLGAIIDGARNTMSTMDTLSSENKEELTSLIANLEQASRNLDSLSTGLNKTTFTMNEILVKINNGEGTLGKMVSDSSLYHNLDSLAFNLNELVKGIQNDPKKYLKHMRLIEVF